jgi:hypothetical protein
MAAMTAADKRIVSAYWADVNFGIAQAKAIYSLDDLIAAAGAIDNAFDTTLNNAVIAVGGTTTVINGLAAVIPAPFSGATVQQKTLMACYVLMKRANII